MSRIAIIAALPGELKPLVVRGWERRGRNVWTGRIDESEAIAIAGGMGAAAARRAVELAFAEFKPNILVSYGWAGALTCAVKPRHAVAVSEVIDDETGERFVTDYLKGYRLITLDHVARAEEKRGLAGKHQAVLVDMEAATVARIAAARNVSFYCFKGISDGYTDRIPDFSRFMDDRGELRMAALLAHVAVRPRYWAGMLRMGKQSAGAAKALVTLVQEGLKTARERT